MQPYRYYVSESLNLRGRAESTSGWRLPGPVIEKAVYGIIRTMLNDQDLLIGAIRTTEIPTQCIPDILAKAQRASQLADQALDGIACRVAVRSDGLEITVTLSTLLPQSIEEREVSVTRITSMQMQRRGNEMRLVVSGAGAASISVDETMVKSIMRAHVWAQELLAGKVAAMTEIAVREKVSDSYVKKVMPLAFLAPDIVEAIVTGTQPYI